MKLSLRPLLMGLFMGPLMVWMIHGALQGAGPVGWALVVFVGAHVLVATLVLSAGFLTIRLFPRFQELLRRIHKPSPSHITLMVVGMLVSTMPIHFVIHGGL